MFQSVRGMQDILPNITPCWAQLEDQLRMLVRSYNYQEIRLPIIEKTELFQRSIGMVTDIIEKEMYHLVSSTKEKSLSLRPEGTVSCVRAAIEHQLLDQSMPQRLWYLGPMFRHERPQKGRYRQFHQFGVEVFGVGQPEIDVELIAMTQRLWKNLHIHQKVHLEINCLGNYEARQHYRTRLVHYFTKHVNVLDEDSKRRLQTNPLRILDSKNPQIVALNKDAPKLSDYLDEASALHFSKLQELLSALNIPFKQNPYLIRGLDYYNKTVFEWVITDATGTQNTVCGGGRYDGLIKQLGGPSKPAAGFAIGLERLLALWIELQEQPIAKTMMSPHLYIIKAGMLSSQTDVILAEKLRSSFPEFIIQIDSIGGNFSQQFKRASASQAYIALVLGEDEIKNHMVTAKYLQIKQPQLCMTWQELFDYLQKRQDAILHKNLLFHHF